MDQDLVSIEVPLVQRKASRPNLNELFDVATLASKKKRNIRIVEAFQKHLYTQREIGEHLGLHPAYLSQIIVQLRSLSNNPLRYDPKVSDPKVSSSD